MIKKITILLALLALGACASVKDKAGSVTPFKKCPPQDERTLADILCKESK
jgi:hypothetical protein